MAPQETALRTLIRQAGWSGEEFARNVNRIGAEAGLQIQYSRASVTQWCSGTRPRAPTPEFMAEAFTRRLGKSISPSAIGFGEAAPPWWQSSIVTQLANLAHTVGSDPRAQSGICVYNLAALDISGLADFALHESYPSVVPIEIGEREINRIDPVVGLLAAISQITGTGVARISLESYFASVIFPWLRMSIAPYHRKELLRAVGRLACLCGYMNFDDELHGRAQRYYRSALALAAAGECAEEYAFVLRSMSAQARWLGHYRCAIRLAEAALRTPQASSTANGFALGQIAAALAASGHHSKALRLIEKAERVLFDAGVPHALDLYDGESTALHRAEIYAYTDARDKAIAAFLELSDDRSMVCCRSRALALAGLARLHLRNGHVEEATRTWHLFIDTYIVHHSGRMQSAFQGMIASLRPYQGSRKVNHLLKRARELNNVASRPHHLFIQERR